MNPGLELKNVGPECNEIVPVENLAFLDDAETGFGRRLDASARIERSHRCRIIAASSVQICRPDGQQRCIIEVNRPCSRVLAVAFGDCTGAQAVILHIIYPPFTEEEGHQDRKYEGNRLHFIRCANI